MLTLRYSKIVEKSDDGRIYNNITMRCGLAIRIKDPMHCFYCDEGAKQ